MPRCQHGSRSGRALALGRPGDPADRPHPGGRSDRVRPGDPADRLRPGDPVGRLRPEDPVGPTSPCGPTAPGSPWGPSWGRLRPGDPVGRSHPVGPPHRVRPGDPVGRLRPEDPVGRSHPVGRPHRVRPGGPVGRSTLRALRTSLAELDQHRIAVAWLGRLLSNRNVDEIARRIDAAGVGVTIRGGGCARSHEAENDGRCHRQTEQSPSEHPGGPPSGLVHGALLSSPVPQSGKAGDPSRLCRDPEHWEPRTRPSRCHPLLVPLSIPDTGPSRIANSPLRRGTRRRIDDLAPSRLPRHECPLAVPEVTRGSVHRSAPPPTLTSSRRDRPSRRPAA